MISFQLPESIEQRLRQEMGDLDQLAKEALAIEAYKAEKLSLGQLAEVLCVSTHEADTLLKERGIALDFSEDELQQERDSLRRLLGT